MSDTPQGPRPAQGYAPPAPAPWGVVGAVAPNVQVLSVEPKSLLSEGCAVGGLTVALALLGVLYINRPEMLGAFQPLALAGVALTALVIWLSTRDSAIWRFRPSGAFSWIILLIFIPIASVIFLTLPEAGRRGTLAVLGGAGLGFAIAVATGWTLI